MRYKNIIVLITLLLININTFSQNSLCSIKSSTQEYQLPFRSGEELDYVLRYSFTGINAELAKVNFRFSKVQEEGKSYYLAAMSGSTLKLYDIFFRARESYQSKIDLSTFKPFYFFRDVTEGKYGVKNQIFFNKDRSIRALVDVINGVKQDTTIKGNGCTFDVISILYYLRTLDYDSISNNQPYICNIAIDGGIYSVSIKYAGREIKRVPGMGHYKTIKLVGSVIEGKVFTGKEQIIVWASDDKNLIPLYFEMPLRVGKLGGRLESYKNIKNRLDSKIK